MIENASSVVTKQVSVTNAETAVVAARSGRVSVTVENHGTTAVYLGPKGVTAATGIRLPGVDGASLTLEMTGPLYGITASGSQTVSVAETVR